ncbi:MAG: ribosome maturation factor RimP [Firmicutes bacterium]|nr:ribosome maturation factor RimP [Bacillota bacterium]
MAKKKITEIIEEISAEFFAQNGLELYNSEFVKEGRDWFLRVYIDKTQEAQYVSTDDCEKVSRFLSAELDRIDPIEQNYYLEVSSPGMDRALLKDKDFVRFAGEIVDISLYKAVDGQKAYQGRLVGIEDGKIIITDEQDNRIEFPREQVAKTKLAVIF